MVTQNGLGIGLCYWSMNRIEVQEDNLILVHNIFFSSFSLKHIYFVSSEFYMAV